MNLVQWAILNDFQAKISSSIQCHQMQSNLNVLSITCRSITYVYGTSLFCGISLFCEMLGCEPGAILMDEMLKGALVWADSHLQHSTGQRRIHVESPSDGFA